MNYKINYNQYNSVFAVPKAVVEKHIRMCSGTALKVLMLILSSSDNIPTEEEMSCITGYNIEDIKDGITFWINVGLLTDIDSNTEAISQIDEKADRIPPCTIEYKEENTEPIKEGVVIPLKIAGKRPAIDRAEVLDYIANNKELAALVESFQQLSGRTLTSLDMECLVSMYTYYGLSADYILMASHYCYTRGKCSMNYVEKVVSSWVEHGVDTHEKLDKHIKMLTEKKTRENLVKSAFGINDRKLVSSEKKLIDKWYDDYKFDISMIKLAYERTVERTGKLTFPYIDKILSNWHEKNINSAKAAAEEDLQYKTNKINQEKSENNCGGSTTSYTYSDLEKIINKGF